MILSPAGQELACTKGFGPVGLGGTWGLLPGAVESVTPQITAAAAQTVDWSTSSVIQYQLTANTTFTFTNVFVGQNITLVLTQDGTGSRTGTFPSGSVFVGGSKTLSTPANSVDTVTILCTQAPNAAAAGVYLCTLSKAYA